MPDDPSQMEWPLNDPRREPVEARPRPRPTFVRPAGRSSC